MGHDPRWRPAAAIIYSLPGWLCLLLVLLHISEARDHMASEDHR